MIMLLKKIVIVGGGVGGLELVIQLGRKLGCYKKVKIILVDCNYSYLWKLLLYEVVIGFLDEGVDVLSYLVYVCNYGFQFQLGLVVDINCEGKIIIFGELCNEKGELLVVECKLLYDMLVMVLGSILNDFNISGVKENCIFFDNLYQVCCFYQEMFNLFFKYFVNFGVNGKVNIVIVGGGVIGVEFFVELYNVVKQLYSYGYKGLINEVLNVMLVEVGECILFVLLLCIFGVVYNELIKLGVWVLMQIMVISVDVGGLYIKDGEYIEVDLMVWVVGIKVLDFMKEIGGFEINCINQLVVELMLQIICDVDIFVIGDCVFCVCLEGGFVFLWVQVVYQMVICVLNNILVQMKGKLLKVYIYKDYGLLVLLLNYFIVGSLMGNLMCGLMMVEGCIVCFVYIFLYCMYQIVLYGYFKIGLMMLVGCINCIICLCLKLY